MTDIFHRKVMVLSPYPERLVPIIEATGDRCQSSDTPDLPDHFDWYVCYGFRHVIREPALSRHRIINLHISLLPWNRGAHPNVWAWLDGTPHGVTIHHVDAGIDTGDIIAQREVPMGRETYASSYDRLHEAMVGLFAETWPLIRAGRAQRWPQPPGGTAHRARDLPHWVSWDQIVQTVNTR